MKGNDKEFNKAIDEIYDDMKKSFDKEGKLIEGKELDPNNEKTAEQKMLIAQELMEYDSDVRKEEESLLEKINKQAEANAKLPRAQKRERLRRAISDYKKHMVSVPKINMEDDDKTSFDKTIAIHRWRVRKNSLENIILRYGNEKKLNDVKRLFESKN